MLPWNWHMSHSLFIWSFSIQWTISKLKIVQIIGKFATSWTKSNDYLEFWKHPLIIYYDFGLYSYTPICLKMNNHLWRMHHVICREFNLVPSVIFHNQGMLSNFLFSNILRSFFNKFSQLQYSSLEISNFFLVLLA